jgi:N-dimethylarginine dimethylaminohydrolase
MTEERLYKAKKSEEGQKAQYSHFDFPCFLMDLPQNFSVKNANNKWMKSMKGADRKVDLKEAIREWLQLYNFLASNSYVITLPEFNVDLQDQVFVANLGIVLHTGDLIISNYASPPRKLETYYGKAFFDLFWPKAKICPHKWEGEAELKHLHDNIYIGGYGQRTEAKSYIWMQKEYPVQIIPVFMKDELCYHLDCSIFPLTEEKTVVCTSLFDKSELRAIASVTEIIDVSKVDAQQGLCNSVRLDNMILNAYGEKDDDDEDTVRKKMHKNHALEVICKNNGFEPVYFNLNEFEKGGAALSCCVLHINRQSYKTQLL